MYLVTATVQLAVAGVGSALPALSVARTRKPWLPSARPLYACGLVQAVKAAPSRLHWKPARPLPVSLPLKPNVAALDRIRPAGPLEIAVSGGVLSTVQVYEAGVGSTSSAPSTARTRKLWLPSAR